MRKTHFRVGLAAIGIFLATGVFMAFSFEEGRIEHGTRLMYRSAHVYLLLAGLANLLMGAFHQWREPGRFRTIQTVGSTLLLLAPWGFLTAFIFEPAPDQLYRPISVVSAFLMLMGTVFLTYGQIKLNSKLADPISETEEQTTAG